MRSLVLAVGVGLLLAAPVPARRADDAVRIVTLGDSITRGVRPGVKPEETFSAVLQERLREKGVRAEVVNVGIGGERTDGALARLDQAVIARRPRIVAIMYGTNDSYVDRGQKECRLTAPQYAANLKALVGRLRKAGIEPVLMTPPRWGDRAAPNGAGEHPNVRLEQYVKACREVARELKVPLVDHFEHWSRARAAGTDLGSWTTDECHPNPRGHREIAAPMLPVILGVAGKARPPR
jgi:acyl-CoA thioesterase-1